VVLKTDGLGENRDATASQSAHSFSADYHLTLEQAASQTTGRHLGLATNASRPKIESQAGQRQNASAFPICAWHLGSTRFSRIGFFHEL
jgi:hypothetical protein